MIDHIEEPMYEPYKYWDPFVERDDDRDLSFNGQLD